MNNNIKIIRLKSGEDIIASAHSDESQESVTLVNPMSMIFKRMNEGKAALLMTPWLPVELVEENVASIFMEDILTVIEPKTSLIEYYNNSVDDMLDYVSDNSETVDESFESPEYTSFEESMDEEPEEESGKESKGRTYH